MQLPTRTTPISRCETLSLYAQRSLHRYAATFAVEPEGGVTPTSSPCPRGLGVT